MSTERKPGSRGVTSTFTGGPKKNDSAFSAQNDSDQNERKKGSTKAPTPQSKGFKKRKKK